ncbi:sigma-70 family RNA polymerase sigma factor [candidate division KSB1 bacterium]
MYDDTQYKAELFEKEAYVHMDSLYNSALKLTFDQEISRDLVQETYYRAYRFFDQFKPGSNCKAWLFRIMKNTFINQYRRNIAKGYDKNCDYDEIKPFIYSLANHKHISNFLKDNYIDRYMSDEVEEALSKVPDHYKMVLILSNVEGFSYKEIAEIMDCPVGTVRSRLSRARSLMFKLLLNYAQDMGYYDDELIESCAPPQAC